MSPKIELIPEIKNLVLGEGPHWDANRQTLYQVDLLDNKIVRYTPSTKQVAEISVAPKKTSFIVPVEGEDDQFLISLDNQLVIISWDGESSDYSVVETLATVDLPNQIFNDGKCDPSGRAWAGAHEIIFGQIDSTKPVGHLYSLEPTTNEFTSHVDKVRITNGLAFNERIDKMWYIDSLKHAVDRFDFDIQSGKISNRTTWFSLEKHQIPGVPDGMTIDSDGNLWVAVFGGARVIKVDGAKPEVLLDTLEMPVEQITSVNFGGEELDELYVTSARIAQEGKEAPKAPANGGTYRVTGLGVKGLPATNFHYSG